MDAEEWKTDSVVRRLIVALTECIGHRERRQVSEAAGRRDSGSPGPGKRRDRL